MFFKMLIFLGGVELRRSQWRCRNPIESG